jgi:hypothetical protein
VSARKLGVILSVTDIVLARKLVVVPSVAGVMCADEQIVIALGKYAPDAVTGGLRLIGNYRHLFTENAVHKRGFSNVRSAYD